MYIEKLKQILGEIAPTHRVRKLKNNSEYAGCMNAFFPGVSPAVQVYSLFNNVSPYCVECNAPVKTPGKQTCSVTCRDAASKKNSTTRVEKAKATLIERYGVDNARQ